MDVNHSSSNTLLAELKTLPKLQKTVSQEDQHQTPVMVWIVLNECTVCFVEIVADIGQLTGREDPELVL